MITPVEQIWLEQEIDGYKEKWDNYQGPYREELRGISLSPADKSKFIQRHTQCLFLGYQTDYNDTKIPYTVYAEIVENIHLIKK